jgi:hypothetical protein
MYTSRIITITETRAGNNEIESERRFLEGVEGQGGATGQLLENQAEPTMPWSSRTREEVAT